MTEALDSWKQAIQSGDVERVRTLFDGHPDLSSHVNDLVFAFDSPALFQARDNLELVDLLLEHGADINLKTGWGAGGFGILEDIEPEVAQPLIDRGAEIDIWAAVSLNRVERTRQLLNLASDLVTAPGGDGKHPLHYAAMPQWSTSSSMPVPM